VQYVGRVAGLPLLLRVVSHAVKVSSAAIASHFTKPRQGLAVVVVLAQHRLLLPNRLLPGFLVCTQLGASGRHLPNQVRLLRN
jgi:hypothetical protein